MSYDDLEHSVYYPDRWKPIHSLKDFKVMNPCMPLWLLKIAYEMRRE